MRVLIGSLITALFLLEAILTGTAVQAQRQISKSASSVATVAKKDSVVLPFENRSTATEINKPYGSHLNPILTKIKATTDQRTKITQIVQSYRSRIQPLRDEYKIKRDEFIKYMVGGGAAEMIMSKQLELGHLSSDMSSKYTLMRLEIRRLLSPDQVVLFEQYAREHGWNH